MSILLVLLAFGFVIFWHELGHFLAARWAGVRVEQFAVGMGQALISWRKGIGVKIAGFGRKGFHWGSTQEAFDKRIDEEHARSGSSKPASALSTYERYEVARKLGIGETEYRLAWIPLGGYVKPTGQDDLRPAAEVGADDPHAFGAKPVGKRMVIISAGVIMNVILAFGVYVLLFLAGFNSPPAVLGYVSPGSPAMEAGLRVGDRIKTINGNVQEDYTKIAMNVALLRDDEPAAFVIERPGEKEPLTVQIKPVRTKASYNMPAIGVMPGRTLESAVEVSDEGIPFTSPDLSAMPAGSVITQINGKDVGVNDYSVLDDAVQRFDGTPINLTIRLPDQQTSQYALTPELAFDGFGSDPLSIVGLRPRVRVNSVVVDSPADKAGVEPNDIVAQLSVVETADALRPPNATDFVAWIRRASEARHSVRLELIRNGEPVPAVDIKPQKTIGVGVGYESQRPIVGEIVASSAAATAGIRLGDRIVSVAGTPVANWFDLINTLRNQSAGDVPVTVDRAGTKLELSLAVDKPALKQVADIRYVHSLPLAQLIEPRQTSNPIVAAQWGVEETKQSIFQVYLTLQRLFQGTVPLQNLSGPIGILSAGSSAADRGMDYLLWFTAMISANLAVVNFLPIPIVDGGLFLFLLLEKITGKPPSPRLQNAAQVFGLVLLGSLFLFVTYHDVLRQFG